MALTLISTHTVDAACGCIDITSGIDSTYDSYEFHCVNIHPANNNVDFGFQVNAAGASGFDEAMTTTVIQAYHNEADSANGLSYVEGHDQVDGDAAYQHIFSYGSGNLADEATSGILTLYAPSSTTYVKHFTSNGNGYYQGDYSISFMVAGYINVTAAIDQISFKFSAGNIDAGTIKMFGVS
jgi:hypothetical protein